MPMLYSLGQHGVLESIQDSLLVDEHLFAYLDDLYVVCSPKRVAAIFKIINEALEAYARIQMHLGVRQIISRMRPSEWTQTPEFGEVKDLQQNRGSEFWASRSVTSILWRPSSVAPPRSTEFCTNGSCKCRELLFCANSRSTYSLRGIPPAKTAQFARGT